MDAPEIDEQYTFEQWARYHQEPAPNVPLNLAADHAELASLSTKILALENGRARPGGGINLATLRMLREFTKWRLFPFNSLPDDIILQIFRQGTFFDPDDNSSSTMPLVYSKVCRRWRNLTMDASWLWSYLGFNDEHPYTLTKVFLERSGAAPLIVKIDITDRYFDFEVDELWPTKDSLAERLSLLLPHIHRWRSFCVRTDNWAPILGVLSILQRQAAPILKRVEFIQNFGSLPHEAQSRLNSPILLCGGAPALQELVLNAVPIDWRRVTFRNLTELQLLRLPDIMPTVQNFWSILHHSPNLRKLSLVEAGPQHDEATALRLPAIELLSLEELELGGNLDGSFTLQYAIFVLSMLRTGTALHTFEMERFPSDSDFRLMLPMIHSHLSRVQTLRLAGLDFDNRTAAHWLHAMPQVNHLSLAGTHTERAMLEALTNPARIFGLNAARDILCPSLTDLATNDPEAQADALRSVVYARCNIGVPIHRLVFDINLRDEIEALPVINSLRNVVQFEFEGDPYDSEEEWTGPDPSDWPME